MNPYPEQGFELQTQNSSNPNQYPEVPPPQCYGQAQPVYPVYPQMPVSGVTYIPQPQSIITNQIVINPTPELRSDSTLMICPFFFFFINTAVNIFISIHLMCMALYAIITVLMFATKNLVIKQNNQVNGKICEMQILIYEFEKIKTKLIDMQLESKKKALPLIDSLLDELRFSDFGLTVDVSDIDTASLDG